MPIDLLVSFQAGTLHMLHNVVIPYPVGGSIFLGQTAPLVSLDVRRVVVTAVCDTPRSSDYSVVMTGFKICPKALGPCDT